MADRNQLKIASQADRPERDPFAELTKIMGFDPRQPVVRKDAGHPALRQVAAPVEDNQDDFSIDLEKELMGEFGADDLGLDDEFDSALAASVEAQNKVDDIDLRAAELDADLELDDHFDEALAEVEQDEPALEAAALDLDEELDAISIEDERVETDVHTAEPAIDDRSYAAAAVDEDEADRAIDLESELGDLVAASAGAESDDAWRVEVDTRLATEQAARAEAARVAAVAAEEDDEAADESDLASDFDSALAEIDMDFASHRDDRPVAAAPAEEEPVEEEVESVAAAEADSAYNGDDLDLRLLDEHELDLDDADTAIEEFGAVDDEAEALDFAADDIETTDIVEDDNSIPAFLDKHEADRHQAPFIAASVQPEPTPEPSPRAEFSLEDELNALLGNILPGRGFARGSAPAENRWVETRPAEHRLPEPVVAAPQEDVSLDDLDWNLDNEETRPADDLDAGAAVRSDDDAEPETYAEPDLVEDDAIYAAVAETVENDDFDVAAAEDAIEDIELIGDWEPEAEEPVDDLPDFDHTAFDAALAKGFLSDDALHADADEEDDQPAPAAWPASKRQDPRDAIAALAAQYTRPSGSYGRFDQTMAASAPVTAPAAAAQLDDIGDIDIDIGEIEFDEAAFRAAAFDEAPDVETVDVADRAVALADDLEIPEFVFDDELPPVSAYDDLDTEFENLLNEMNAGDNSQSRPTAQAATGYDDSLDDFSSSRAPAYGAAAAVAAGAYQASARTDYDDELDQGRYELDADDLPGSQPLGAEQYADDGYDYDPALDEEIAVPDMAAAERRRPPARRGMLIAAIVGGVAIAGGLGAFALSFGDGGIDAPVLVKADDSPIKVRPTNPGGTVVPNQDSKVYETVAGAKTGASPAPSPQQEKLVTTAEEPVDVTPPAPEPRAVDLGTADNQMAAGTPKGEDRIEQMIDEAAADSDTEVAAIAPRKVRTMVVRPDGTLVPREDPAPAATAPTAPATAAAAIEDPLTTATTPDPKTALPPLAEALPAEVPVAALTPPAEPTAAALPKAETPVAGAPVAEAPIAEALAPAKPAPEATSSTTPDSVPIAPQRPSSQPVDVVGEVKADQVAAIAPTAAAPVAGGGTWSMQIASQPSEAAAQSSYQDLARRYGGVLSGREVNIVKAEIAGKGTFWRVRVPAKSRNDAVGLCENYKAAGGNCFVSR